MYLQLTPPDTNNPAVNTQFETLTHYCRCCGYVDTTSSEYTVVFSQQLKDTTNKHVSSQITPYTKHDPTLPRTNNMICPNDACRTNHPTSPEPREIINFRYDDRNMMYAFICTSCDHTWTLN